ncbi:hypothetical protein FACS189472_02100 [Alphaproteobacteria bacterium]|nr:hypothetical protein FACS189472_02100 [Alphaproteobacteria bacterium]
MAVQRGSTNLLIRRDTPRLFSAVSIVTGSVPTDDLEKKATDNAGNMHFKETNGRILLRYKKIGKMNNPCTTLARTTTLKYPPSPFIFTPLFSCIMAVDIKPKSAIGSILIIQLTTIRNISWIFLKKLFVDVRELESGIYLIAMPTTTPISRAPMTLCSKNGENILDGIIFMTYSEYLLAAILSRSTEGTEAILEGEINRYKMLATDDAIIVVVTV